MNHTSKPEFTRTVNRNFLLVFVSHHLSVPKTELNNRVIQSSSSSTVWKGSFDFSSQYIFEQRDQSFSKNEWTWDYFASKVSAAEKKQEEWIKSGSCSRAEMKDRNQSERLPARRLWQESSQQTERGMDELCVFFTLLTVPVSRCNTRLTEVVHFGTDID